MDYKSFLTDTWSKFSSLFNKFVKKTYVGSRADWDLLSVAEKKQYDLADFTDDTASGVPIISDAVTDGDMNPVTSNAVSKYGIRYKTTGASPGFTPDIENSFIKFRKSDGILTLNVKDSTGTGVSIDFDYGVGHIRFYKVVNGSVTDTWDFSHS